MLEKKISLFTNNKGNEFLTQLEATLELSDKLDSVVEAVKAIPETVIPETLIPDYPSEMVISNLPDVQKVELVNPPKEKDDTAQLAILEKINSELKNIGQKEIDLSELQATLDAILASSSKVEQKEVKQIDTKPELNAIREVLNTLNDNVVSIDIPELDYKKLAQIIKENVKISVSSSGGGSSMVTNRDNVQINPATSDNQETLNYLIETLQGLNVRLTAIASTVANTAQLRVVQTSVPSTAVTGPITSAQSIAEKAVGGILYSEKVAITNNAAIQSNINNVSIN